MKIPSSAPLFYLTISSLLPVGPLNDSTPMHGSDEVSHRAVLLDGVP